MARRQSSVWNSIRAMCAMQEMDEDYLYKKAKLLLSCYRNACWVTYRRTGAPEDASYYINNPNLKLMIDYLKAYLPEEKKSVFEAKLSQLQDSRLLVELVEETLMRVREFPDYGEQYHEILSKGFLVRVKYTEAELLDALSMERSRYYDRKKEAIMVFGVVLWGTEIPRLEELFTGKYT